MNPSRKELVQRLVELLTDEKESWVFDEYTCDNRSKMISVWTAWCPILDTNTWPVKMNLSLIDKWRIWKAVKIARRNFIWRKLK